MTLTPADASPAAEPDVSAAAVSAKQGSPVSALKAIDTKGMKIISAADNPELRDQMATNWLNMRAAKSAFATEVPDNAPQNVYATVKVNGKVVATLYNGGTSAMTNDAAQRSETSRPSRPEHRWRQCAAMACGVYREGHRRHDREGIHRDHTVRMDTAPGCFEDLSRAQLDTAYQAMMAEGQKATAQRLAGYATPREASGVSTDFNA